MEEMTTGETQAFVARARFGCLSLAEGGKAYAVPMFYGYDGRRFYFHWHPGLKDRFAERTDEACLVVVRAESEDVWRSVLAFGPIRRVEDGKERLVAMDALMSVPLPPEYGESELGEPLRTGGNDVAVWCLEPARVTGRKSARPLEGAEWAHPHEV